MRKVFNYLYAGNITDIQIDDNEIVLNSEVKDITPDLIAVIDLDHRYTLLDLGEENADKLKTAIAYLGLNDKIIVIKDSDLMNLNEIELNNKNANNIILDGSYEILSDWYCYDIELHDKLLELMDEYDVNLVNWHMNN